jgi:hypothetical protein
MATAPTATASAAKKSPGPKPGTNTGKRVPPQLTAATAAVVMPVVSLNKTTKSIYPFDALTEIGMSFGVIGKSAKQLASVVSNQNKLRRVPKTDENGQIVYTTREMKGPDGTVTKVPTTEPELVPGKVYFAHDCDPKADPDGASVRIFRQK